MHRDRIFSTSCNAGNIVALGGAMKFLPGGGSCVYNNDVSERIT
jgi:hypothetical protein